MTNLPATIDTQGARLPESYSNARMALAECNRIDECKDWADKAAALASYAKQADDDELYQMARRIQGRAVRRYGDLLGEFQNERARTDLATGTVTQRSAAQEAGISRRQEATSRQVAAIPGNEFEALIESDNPPSITALADMGRREQPKPEGFVQATHLIGAVRRFADFCGENEPRLVAGGVLPHEIDELREMVSKIDTWLDVFVINLGGEIVVQ